ncbi:MAG: hypothetical protein ACREM2_05080 [Vulcanimicrobiaceae bacterium]
MTPRRALGIVRKHSALVLSVLIAALVCVGAYHFLVPTQYVATSTLLMTNEDGANEDTYMGVLPTIVGSSTLLTQVQADLHDQIDSYAIKGRIKAVVRGTTLGVVFQGSDPALAVAVVNATADDLSRYYSRIATLRYDNDVRGISDAAAAKRSRLDQLDSQLQQLAAKTGLPLNSDSQSDSVTSELDALSSERAQAYQQYVSDLAFARSSGALISTSDPSAESASLLATDPAYQAKLTALQKDQAELAGEQAQYTEDYPGLVALQQRVAREQAVVDNERQRVLAQGIPVTPGDVAAITAGNRAGAAVSADKARLDALDSQISHLEGQIAGLSSNGLLINTLRAERDAVKSQFIALSQSLAQTLSAKATAASYGNLIVLDRAQSADVSPLSGRKFLALLFLIAVALALGSAFVAESLEQAERDAAPDAAAPRKRKSPIVVDIR